MRQPRQPLRLALAGLLGMAAAVLLASCGSTGKGLIPAAQAGPLGSDFEMVAQAAQVGNGNCAATAEAIAKTEQDFQLLPGTVDPGLRARLRLGIANLASRAREMCLQPAPGATTATSPATRTSSTSATRTSTQSSSSSTSTSSTPSTSTSTTNTSTTGAPPGGGTPGPSESGGTPGSNGSGNGQGNGEGNGAGAGGTGAGNGNGQVNGVGNGQGNGQGAGK
jgi:hypothetical protein